VLELGTETGFILGRLGEELLTLMVTGFDVEGTVAVLRDEPAAEFVGRAVAEVAGFAGLVRATEADEEGTFGTGLGR
jgi:hypothetical protein